MDKTCETITLADGRQLAYAVVGDPDGLPVFNYHGLPGSRLQTHPDESIMTDLGARVICPDRPGMGCSTPQARRKFLDWPADVAALADHLGIDRFRVIGLSGGCPYALATAYQLPERVEAMALVSGIGPLSLPGATQGMMWGERLMFWLARHAAPVLNWPFALIARQLRQNREWGAKRAVMTLPDADLRLSRVPAFRQMFQHDFLEATRQGAGGVHQEAVLLASPWDFNPADLSPEIPVMLWHGEDDTIVPVTHGRWLGDVLPNCRAVFLPGEGHYLVLERFREILRQLLMTSV